MGTGRFILDKGGLIESDFISDVVLTMSNFVNGTMEPETFTENWNKFAMLISGAWLSKNGEKALAWKEKQEGIFGSEKE